MIFFQSSTHSRSTHALGSPFSPQCARTGSRLIPSRNATCSCIPRLDCSGGYGVIHLTGGSVIINIWMITSKEKQDRWRSGISAQPWILFYAFDDVDRCDLLSCRQVMVVLIRGWPPLGLDPLRLRTTPFK